MTDAELRELRAKCDKVFPLAHEYGVSQEFIPVAIEAITKLFAEIDRLRAKRIVINHAAAHDPGGPHVQQGIDKVFGANSEDA